MDKANVGSGDGGYHAYVHDLADEYPPALGDMIAAKIPGAKSIAPSGLGHFPHCEDYTLFKTRLHPVPDEIVARG